MKILTILLLLISIKIFPQPVTIIVNPLGNTSDTTKVVRYAGVGLSKSNETLSIDYSKSDYFDFSNVPFTDTRKYGSIGNGTTDNAAYLTSAINQYGKIIIPSGNYKVNSALSFTGLKDKKITIEGQGNVTLDFSAITDAVYAISFVGSADDAINLAASLSPGDTIITSSSEITAEVGDILEILSTDIWGSTSGIYRRELVCVKSVSGTTITLYNSIFDDYDYTTTTVKNINANTIEIKNINFIGNSSILGQSGLQVTYGRNIKFENCTFTNFRHMSMNLNACYGFGVFGNVAYNSDQEGFGYGISCISSQNGLIENNSFYSNNFGVQMGMLTRNIIVKNNYSNSNEPYAWDTHEACEYITFDNNRSNGGFYMRGINISLINNWVFVNKSFTPYHFILYGYAPRKNKYVNISNNHAVLQNSSVDGQGIRFQFFSDNDSIENIIANGNEIENNGHTIYFDVASGKTGNYIGNVLLSNNICKNINATKASVNFSGDITYNNIKISGGIYNSLGHGISCTGSTSSGNIDISGAVFVNVFYPFSMAAGTFNNVFIRNSYLSGADFINLAPRGYAVIQGNVIENCDTGGLSVTNDCDKLIYKQNTLIGVTGDIINNAVASDVTDNY